MARTWLITGGTGFIGSHLCDALLARGDAVRTIDRMPRMSTPASVRVIVGDIEDESRIQRAMNGCDGCFHLASVASVQQCDLDPVRSSRVNVGGTIAVLRAAAEAVIPVVYASSCAVYGNARYLPSAEHDQCRPLSSYGADKLRCEMEAEIAEADYGLQSIGLRMFNIYGHGQDPRSPYSGVISNLADRLSHGLGLNVFGDGTQTRDFVVVGDVVMALLAAMNAVARDGPRVFNVASGTGTSIIELATVLSDLMGRKLDIRHQPARPREIRHSVGSPALARNRLGLPPPTPLREGLAAMLAAGALAA